MKIILKAIIFSLFLNMSSFAEVNFQQKKFYYENLVKNWSKIFPDKNRNAAGPRFFKYLIDQNLTYEEFKEYTSHNTDRLNVKEIKEILLNLDFIKDSLIY